MLSTKAKEAIKTGLAFTLVYGIALRLDWMNPYWAGFAVAMIALPTAGQSLRKGMLRLAGTIPGCIAALVILSLAPQNRWAFMLLISAWIFFTTYMMLADKSRAYLWNVAGFVCLIITLAGPGSSAHLFEFAVFRTLETVMGIVVYTLVSVFLWPRTNLGAIKQVSTELVAAQAKLLRAGGEVIGGRGTAEKLPALHAQEVKHLAALAQALQAEGSESYEVHELGPLWARFHGLSTALMSTLDRWQTGFTELAAIDVPAALPNFNPCCVELGGRLEEIQGLLGGSPPAREWAAVPLIFDHAAVDRLTAIERAALAMMKKELENLETLTAAMLECAGELAGYSADAEQARAPLVTAGGRSRALQLPVIDLDDLQGAIFAAVATMAGFLLWIFLDPPGHNGWYQLSGTLGMMVASMPQMRATMLIKPFGIALAVGLAAYVVIMPQLSSFFGLGVLLFLAMFSVHYFCSGIAVLAGQIAVINMLAIQNQQVYNFAAMANACVFTLLGFVFIFALSYMKRAPRPEKAVVYQLGRFFRSTEFLISRLAPEPGHQSSFLTRWKTDFYRHELQSLPAKISAWGKAVDYQHFANNTPEQVQALVNSLQSLAYRIEQLLDADHGRQAEPLSRALGEDLGALRAGIVTTLGAWSSRPEAEPSAALSARLATRLAALEQRIDEAFEQADVGALSGPDIENFYRLLGGYRGVSEAAVAYAGTAGTIDWAQWREEVFS